MTLTNPTYLVDETFVNLDISAGASICTYDALADGWVVIEVYVTVAGGDEYTVWLTRKWGGIGTAHELAPLTLITPTGTDLSFLSIPIHLKEDDQIAVMVDGLVGDTSVSGGVRIAKMNYSILEQSDILSDATPFAGANVDVSVSSRSDFDNTSDQVIVTTNNDKTGYALSAAGVDGIMDEVYEGTRTFRQWLRLAAAVLFNKSSGGGSTTGTFRDDADSKARVTATLDTNGNRTNVTLDDS